MNATFGPRFAGGGYQFPRTHSATLARGEPIRVETLGGGARASIVPLRGGREPVFDVCGSWTVAGEDGPVTVSSSYLAHDELEAIAELGRLIRTITREERNVPDGLNSFEVNRQARQREEVEKFVRRGIAVAQTAPESIEIVNNYAAAIVDDPGGDPARCGLQVCLPSGRQMIVSMGLEVQENIGDELAARRGRAQILDGADPGRLKAT